MADNYKKTEQCSANKKRKILTAFDNMIVDMLRNKKLKSNNN